MRVTNDEGIRVVEGEGKGELIPDGEVLKKPKMCVCGKNIKEREIWHRKLLNTIFLTFMVLQNFH